MLLLRRSWPNGRTGMTVLVALTMVVLVGACARPAAQGTGATTSAGIEVGTVAGLPINNRPSGARSGVEDASIRVIGGDGGDTDRLAGNAMADVQEYWRSAFPAAFNSEFKPAARLVSYDAGGADLTVCQSSTRGQANAFYCPGEDTIAWDRGQLLPMLIRKFGTLAVPTVLAHETGHLVQSRLREANQSTPTIVLEQQADCYTGAFFRHVAQDQAPHFQMSTGTGLSQVLSAMFFIRDQPGSPFTGPNAHGNAFDRVLGFQLGFTEGPARCRSINVTEVNKRITAFGFTSADEAATGGELAINQENIGKLGNQLDAVFTKQGFQAPRLRLGNLCADGTPAPTRPTGYCDGENLMTVDIPGLARIGAPLRDGLDPESMGDFAAFAEIASRYVLAVQQQAGLSLTGQAAALRTSCLVGVWAGLLLEKPWGDREPIGGLQLAAGDLDEAVAELLSAKSLIAADVNGETVKSGFARVEAFRVGFLEGTSSCLARFKG